MRNQVTPSTPQKLNIVLFWFTNDWGLYGRAYEQIAKNLPKLPEVGRVICVFPPKQRINEEDKISLHTRPITTSLTLLEETELSKPKRSRLLAYMRYRIDALRRDNLFKTHLRHNGFRSSNTILWLFPPHPYIQRLLAIVPRIGVVTQIIDDFTKFDPSHILFQRATSQYPDIGKWADAIFVTSKANLDKFTSVGKPCSLFYPAVDQCFLGKPTQLPHKISHESPRLGYLGYIMDRTDLDLIAFVAEQRPHCQLILAGPEYPQGYLTNSCVLLLPNVEYIGSILPENAPAFLDSLDVCLMPHRDNEYSRSMGPLKLYQYLASGRPIVSTNVAGLDLVRHCIFVANNKQEFLDHIERALETDTIELSSERIKLASENTWITRVGAMLADINKYILARSGDIERKE